MQVFRVKNLKKPYRRENCAVVASTNGAKTNFGSRSCKTNKAEGKLSRFLQDISKKNENLKKCAKNQGGEDFV